MNFLTLSRFATEYLDAKHHIKKMPLRRVPAIHQNRIFYLFAKDMVILQYL